MIDETLLMLMAQQQGTANEFNKKMDEITLAFDYMQSKDAKAEDIFLILTKINELHEAIKPVIRKAKKWKRNKSK